MDGLTSVATNSVEPAVDMVLDLKKRIDGQVTGVMAPLNA